MSATDVHLAVDNETNPAGNQIQPISTPKQILSPEKSNGGESTHRRQTHLPLSERLGLNELFSLHVLHLSFTFLVWRASVGELIGSAVLVFMLDCIVISTIETGTKMPNLIMSILIAVIITILLLAVFPISGGHINPVISFSAALVGLISISRGLIYILAQCAGAMLGALALKAVVSHEIQQTFSLGGCTLSVIPPGSNGLEIGIETTQAFWLEIFCTFIFLFASVWMAYDHRQAKRLGLIPVFMIIGIVLGLLVFVSTTVTTKKGYAGVGMNPARCFGAAVVRGGHLWEGHWVFWVGPIISCFAFYIYTKIIPGDHFHAEGYKHDFLGVMKASFKFNGSK